MSARYNVPAVDIVIDFTSDRGPPRWLTWLLLLTRSHAEHPKSALRRPKSWRVPVKKQAPPRSRSCRHLKLRTMACATGWWLRSRTWVHPRPADASALAALVNKPSLDVAYWAATLLGRLESQAAPAVPQLAEALDRHTESTVRERAAWALGKIGPAAAGPELAGSRGQGRQRSSGSSRRRVPFANRRLTLFSAGRH